MRFLPTALKQVVTQSFIHQTFPDPSYLFHIARMTSKIVRHWDPPATNGVAYKAPFTLYNSLLDEKVPFIPAAGAESKQITWYTCGPTVYDSAHMGHARNYVTFDIVRRVLEDYFGYNCLFVMNVTDVDDKIILRARRNYLLNEYKSSGKTADEVGRATCMVPAWADLQAQPFCLHLPATWECTFRHMVILNHAYQQ